ncbi:MAG: class I SAM-dependent methyltransferase [Candidatus Bathyarchaeota archaeon]|nr:class I SAM-dependent methyltransferase [Candidatus Bathyarchaeota archaeon]
MAISEKEMSLDLYDNPFYYEIAFSFRDINREIAFFEQCIKKFSKIKVKNVLDIGCGPSPYMLELAKRGYAFAGLDLSKAMLEYSLEKARKAGIKIKTIHAEMRTFKTKGKFDFAFCMLGSIAIESNRDFLSHLDSVANCLRSGGLYLIDSAIQFDWTRLGKENWTITRNGLTVNVTWEGVPVNFVDQKIIDRTIVEVIENEKTRVFKTEKIDKIVFPQEFLELVEKNRKFEFVGGYNNFNLAEPLEKAKKINRPTTLLRRK